MWRAGQGSEHTHIRRDSLSAPVVEPDHLRAARRIFGPIRARVKVRRIFFDSEMAAGESFSEGARGRRGQAKKSACGRYRLLDQMEGRINRAVDRSVPASVCGVQVLRKIIVVDRLRCQNEVATCLAPCPLRTLRFFVYLEKQKEPISRLALLKPQIVLSRLIHVFPAILRSRIVFELFF